MSDADGPQGARPATSKSPFRRRPEFHTFSDPAPGVPLYRQAPSARYSELQGDEIQRVIARELRMIRVTILVLVVLSFLAGVLWVLSQIPASTTP